MSTPTQKKLRAKEVAKVYGIGLSTVWHYAKLAILCSTCTKSIKAQNSTFFQI